MSALVDAECVICVSKNVSRNRDGVVPQPNQFGIRQKILNKF